MDRRSDREVFKPSPLSKWFPFFVHLTPPSPYPPLNSQVITDMGVCPFSVDASRAGLPVGQVRYPVSREATAEAVYREYWREVRGGLRVCAGSETSLDCRLVVQFSLARVGEKERERERCTPNPKAARLWANDEVKTVLRFVASCQLRRLAHPCPRVVRSLCAALLMPHR